MGFIDRLAKGVNEALEDGAKKREVIDREKEHYSGYDDRRLLMAYKESGGNTLRKIAILELLKERGVLKN